MVQCTSYGTLRYPRPKGCCVVALWTQSLPRDLTMPEYRSNKTTHHAPKVYLAAAQMVGGGGGGGE